MTPADVNPTATEDPPVDASLSMMEESDLSALLVQHGTKINSNANAQ